jgi:hypothetical protein
MALCSRRAVRAGVGLLLLTSTAGCARQTRVVLHQAGAPPSQRELTLTGRWSYGSESAGRRRCLLAFPLPGARTAMRDFLIYLTAPTAGGPLSVRPHDPGGVQGFLIQEVGARRGKTEFSRGTVEFHDLLLAADTRRLEIDVICQDGSRVSGRAFVNVAPDELRSFEHRYAADIAEMYLFGSAPPGAPREGTERRAPP